MRSLSATWGLAARQDVLLLVVSELVTNAVLHARCGAGRQIALTLSRAAGGIRVEVRDAGDGFPHPRDDVPFTQERGRGLAVVTAVAADWGTTREVVGKTVWALVALDPGDDGAGSSGREAQPCVP